MRRDRILRIFGRDRRVPRYGTHLCRRDSRDRWIKVVGLIVVEVRTTVARDEGHNLAFGRDYGRVKRIRFPMEGESVLDASASYGEDVGGRVEEVRFCDLVELPDLLPDHPITID